MNDLTASERSARAVGEIISAFTTTQQPGIVVDSPPGAGKSELAVTTTRELTSSGDPVRVVAQTNAQVDDIIERMARPGDLVIGRLSASDYVPSPQVVHPAVTISRDLADLRACQVVVGTAAKWDHAPADQWPWAIIDEAYQMRSDLLLRLASRFSRILFVGDPGQLDPFSTVDEVHRWAGLPWDPMQSAVAVLLRNNPQIPLHRLPMSWRLPPSAIPVVQRAFYPFTPFAAATEPKQRWMHPLPGLGGKPVDKVIDVAAHDGWGFYELPARNVIRTDAEAIHAVAQIAARLLERGTRTFCERYGERRLTADRIAIGAVHRVQVAAISQQLRLLGGDAARIRVDTANRLQGSEYAVTVVLHPLSGRIDATEFHLESGRLCVLASRHRHACIVVGRAGIADLLDAHPSNEPMHLHALVKFPDGWEANQSVLAHLMSHRVAAG